MNQPAIKGAAPSPSGWQAAKNAANQAPQQPGIVLCPHRKPKIGVSWRAHDFRRVRKGTTVIEDLVISSTGGQTLTGIQVHLAGADFQIGNPGAHATSLAPGADTTVQIKFAPTTLGKKTGTIRITSNASNENPIDLTVSGRPVAVITFKVEDEKTGDALESVTLKVKQSGRKEKEVTTGPEGSVELETEHAGNFRVVLGDHESLLEFRNLATA